MTSLIVYDYPVSFGEILYLRVPHGRVFHPAVDKNYRAAFSLFFIV
jgi:hypothetical protein